METLLAFVIGGLYAAGIFLMLRRALARVVLGLAILTNAANLLIFTAAGLTRGEPPLIGSGEEALTEPYADPLPQALVLTAIVIGFGVLAFAMVLIYRAYRVVGSEDTDRLTTTDRTPEAD
jgi:multicomponent Na+:H+ antiporter subunit C